MNISPVFQQFLQLMVLSVITAAVPAITIVVVGLVKSLSAQVYSKMSLNERFEFNAVVEMAIKAAEQSGLTDELLKDGKQKKEWAIDLIQTTLNERGLGNISVREIEAQLEASILDGLHKPTPSYVYAQGFALNKDTPDEDPTEPVADPSVTA